MIREQDREIKLAIVDAIGQISDPKAITILQFQSNSRDKEFKEHLIGAVRNLGLKNGRRVLEILMRDRDADIQWKSFLAAMTIDPAWGKTLMARALRNPPDSFLTDILELPADQRDQLLELLLRSKSPRLSNAAVTYALAHEPRYGKLLRSLVEDVSVQLPVRRRIAEHLATRAAPADKQLFERLTQLPGSPELNHLAAWTLVRYQDAELEMNFRGLMSADDPVLQAIGAYGLATLHEK